MTRSIRRAVAATTLALAAAGSLTACSPDTPADFDAPEEQSAPAGTPVSGTGMPSPGQGEGADGAPDAGATERSGQVVGPEDAVDTIVYDLPGTDARDEATVTVGFHSLRVEDEVMRLELSFTPEFNGEGSYNIFTLNSSNRLLPVLNDRVNLKQYTLLEDDRHEWATDTTNFGVRVGSGETIRYWGYFAAPEDDIDTISVGVGMVEFDDVPIERGE